MRHRPCLLVCLSCMAAGSNAMPWRHSKRKPSDSGPETGQERDGSSFLCQKGAAAAAELKSTLRTLSRHLTLRHPSLVFNMDRKEERSLLIDALWRGDFVTTLGRFSRMNPEIVSIFENLIDDSSGATLRFRDTILPRFEGTLSHLVRSRSQKRVPIEVAVLSLTLLHYKVPHFAWQAIAQLTRAIMSLSWTVQLCDDALLRDPGPPYQTASGMTAAVFDNFMMMIGYGSYATQEYAARRFAMTNWASVFLPAVAVPADFRVDRMLGNGGIFRDDIALTDFLDMFSMVNLDLLNNKRRRWAQLLDSSVAGKLWSKEPYASPYPPTVFQWHDPIFDRLQSSYEDVNFELDLMRQSDYHRYSDCIQIGGDGLSYMRLIHRLAQDPQQFLCTKPLIIPRLGARSISPS